MRHRLIAFARQRHGGQQQRFLCSALNTFYIPLFAILRVEVLAGLSDQEGPIEM